MGYQMGRTDNINIIEDCCICRVDCIGLGFAQCWGRQGSIIERIRGSWYDAGGKKGTCEGERGTKWDGHKAVCM